jgi:hypothetical protein
MNDDDDDDNNNNNNSCLEQCSIFFPLPSYFLIVQIHSRLLLPIVVTVIDDNK